MTEHEIQSSETSEGEQPSGGPESEGGGKEHPNYLAVWGGLAILTLLEVGVAFVDLSRSVIVLTLVGMAIWKALLVALYFMHLRFEPRRLVLVAVAPLPLAVILVMAVLQEF